MQSGSEATISFYVKSETPVGRMCTVLMGRISDISNSGRV